MFKVTLQTNNLSFTTARDETVLESALRQGITIPYNCKNGTCGACIAKVVEGEISHIKEDLPALSHEEQRSGYSLLCQAVANSNATVAVRMRNTPLEIKARKRPCRIVQIDKFSDEILRLKLQLPKTEAFVFLAGQYINIVMRNDKKLAFFLANTPEDNEFLELHIAYNEIAAIFKDAIKELKENTLLQIDGPYGQDYLNEDNERPIIMVAIGTGFAAVKSMVEHSLAIGLKRPITLYCHARTIADLYLAELAASWSDKYQHIEYIPMVSELTANTDWQGRIGSPKTVLSEDFEDFDGYEVYICGPLSMTKAVYTHVQEKGLAEQFIHSHGF